jgi:hypothetical protein
MAYNSQKGTQHTGDIQYESDPNDTQIDFENDFVAIKTNGTQRLIVSGSAITAPASVPLPALREVRYRWEPMVLLTTANLLSLR